MRRLSWPCSQSVHLVSHCQRRRGYGDDVSCGRRWIGSEVVRGPVLPRACRTMCAFLREVGWSEVHVRACTLSVPRVGLGRISRTHRGWTCGRIALDFLTFYDLYVLYSSHETRWTSLSGEQRTRGDLCVLN